MIPSCRVRRACLAAAARYGLAGFPTPDEEQLGAGFADLGPSEVAAHPITECISTFWGQKLPKPAAHKAARRDWMRVAYC